MPRRLFSRVVAIVPAYNEAETITATIEALQAQWAPQIDRIIVVPNNCTDNTADLARLAGAEVWEMPGHNKHRKAGALNWAINRILPELSDIDYILVTDADSHLDPDWTSHALRALRSSRLKGKPAGAVCANFYLKHIENETLLDRFQRMEYERFARQVILSGRAIVLSGVATMFEVPLIKKVIKARNRGRIPGYKNEFYNRDAATEDIELTFAVKALGYKPLAPKKAVAYTDSMPNWTQLKNQRIRWQRGMLDSLRAYGIRRITIWPIMQQSIIYFGSLVAPIYLAFLTFVGLTAHSVPFDPNWLWVTVVFVLERVVTIRTNRWLAAILIPEWVYEQFRSIVYWLALIKTLRREKHIWINA